MSQQSISRADILEIGYEEIQNKAEEIVRNKFFIFNRKKGKYNDVLSLSQIRKIHEMVIDLKSKVSELKLKLKIEEKRGDGLVKLLDEIEALLAKLRYLMKYTWGRLRSEESRRAFDEYSSRLENARHKILDILKQLKDGLSKDKPLDELIEKLSTSVEKLHLFSEAVIGYYKYYSEYYKSSSEERG